MFLQPSRDAWVVKPVFTREHRNLLFWRDFVHAYTTVSLSVIPKHIRCDLFPWEGLDVGGGGGTWGVVGGGLFHELGDDAVHCFLGGDEVAVLAAAHGGEEAHEGVDGHAGEVVLGTTCVGSVGVGFSEGGEEPGEDTGGMLAEVPTPWSVCVLVELIYWLESWTGIVAVARM